MEQLPYEIHPLQVLNASDVIHKNEDHFGVWPPSGDIDVEVSPHHGLYWRGMRFLSRWSCRVLGIQPVPLWAQGRREPFFDRIHRILPVITFLERGDPSGHRHVVRLSLSQIRVLEKDGLVERCSLENGSPYPVQVPFSWEMDCDFMDLFEVRGMRRVDSSARHVEWENRDRSSIYRYLGEDSVERETRISVQGPPPEKVDRSRWSWVLSLKPGESLSFLFQVRFQEGRRKKRFLSADFPSVPFSSVDKIIRGRESGYRRFEMSWPEVISSDPFIDRCFRQAIQDLRILCTPSREGLIPYAGLPWFSTVFGRDAIITGLSTLWAYPALSRTILLFLGKLQARRTDPFRAAEPGKILHEMRTGEMARTNEVPFGRYYGSVDSTPLYLVLAAQYANRTGDYSFLEELWPVVERAFSWIERYGVDPRTGFLVYRGDTNGGLIQQGWKDSEDSVFHADGELAPHPIALAEVQSYLYWAYDSFATIARHLGHARFSNSCRTLAVQLKKSFLRDFWVPELKTFALALDGALKPCRVRSSNAGHVLLSGLASSRTAGLLGRSLLEADLFSGWGIRTLGNREVRFNPVSYHNGSVWPHDNALILWGMSRHGLSRSVEKLSAGYLDGLRFFRDQRPPELYCGFDRKDGEGPFSYPTSCSPQAWSVASLFLVLQTLGGFRFDSGSLVGGDPVLPGTLSGISFKNVPVFAQGKAFVNLSIHRSEGKAKTIFID